MQNMFSKLDITQNDIKVIFELMDTENEGELSYDYLVDNLRMCQLDDTRKSLTMLRLECTEIARCCKRMYASFSLAHPTPATTPTEAANIVSADSAPSSPESALMRKRRRNTQVTGVHTSPRFDM